MYISSMYHPPQIRKKTFKDLGPAWVGALSGYVGSLRCIKRMSNSIKRHLNGAKRHPTVPSRSSIWPLQGAGTSQEAPCLKSLCFYEVLATRIKTCLSMGTGSAFNFESKPKTCEQLLRHTWNFISTAVHYSSPFFTDLVVFGRAPRGLDHVSQSINRRPKKQENISPNYL